jgi:peptidoglycan/LPS O-acetylase OafA/YrhL
MKSRYQTLDALRGLAALCVVCWHWQLLSWNSLTLSVVLPDPSVQPFYALLKPFYKHGFIGVDLFFTISGFVFFYLYSERVANRTVSLWQFATNRFSRLYPLHFLTLLIVVLLQSLYWRTHGGFYCYQANDLKHFVLQLFLASNWWPTSPFSFNAPVWSLSIEVVLYAVFFFLARLGFARPWIASAIAVMGALLVTKLHFVGWGLMSFYLGGLCFFVVNKPNRTSLSALIAAMIGSLIAYRMQSAFILGEWMTIVIVFPMAIVTLALSEEYLARATHVLRWLGDISYSSYLLHFPLLLGLTIIGERSGITLNANSKVLFIVFFTALIAISLISFRFFERPVQAWLRCKLIPRDEQVDLPAVERGRGKQVDGMPPERSACIVQSSQ